MAVPQDTSLNGLRSKFITSIFGRRLSLAFGNSSDGGDYLAGPKDLIVQVEGVSSAGSTIATTSPAAGQTLSAYGMSIVGATAASASTAYNLNAPIPGTVKRIFNVTTGQVNVATTGAGAFICSTGSITSTQGNIFLTGKGAWIEMWALTTNLWGLVVPSGITSVTTGATIQVS